jgi:iron complex outermembrane recepter protein
MKKSMLLLAAAWLYAMAAFANSVDKTSLSGKVIDSLTNQTIPGALIYFPDLKRGTNVRADGSYFMDQLPKTQQHVRVTAIGYASVIRVIDLSTITHLDFILEPAVTEMKEVVVTGSSHATELSRNPIPIVVLTHDDLQKQVVTNAVEALTAIPGVNAVSTGPNVSKPFIRGLGGNRVLTMYDGIRQEGQQWGEEHGVEIDQFAIDRVEVIKGPASLMYGSDALAGVVNFLPYEPPTDSGMKATLLTGYQSNNGQATVSAHIENRLGNFYQSGIISQKSASNYSNQYDGKVYGTKFSEFDASLNLGLTGAWGYSYVGIASYSNTQEIPDGERDSLSRRFV